VDLLVPEHDAGVVRAATVLEEALNHPVGTDDYIMLARLVTSAATVGGALGSGLESDDAIRAAAYGRRERERHEDAADADSADSE